MTESAALSDPRLVSIDHEVTSHGPVASLQEAARQRGLEPAQVIKTLVVRRSPDDYLFVLVPGDRAISWPKLRRHLGVNRISMPDADEALAVTGYARGTITPFGSTRDWPVLADTAMPREVSIGGGAPGVAVTVRSDDLIATLDADRANVTDPI